MKRLLVWVCITAIFCSGVSAATFGPQSLVSTPDAEFVTLSDMASTPVAATAGDSVATVEAIAILGAAPAVTPVVTSSEGTSNVVTTGVTTGVLDVVKQATAAGSGTNVVMAADTSTELMPVESFGENKGKQNLISVALDDVPLQDVVRLFTRISGANIISSSTNLSGKVTVNLQDVEWKPALDSILDMYNLMVAEKVPGSGIYSVMSKVPGAEPFISQSIFLENASLSNVVAAVMPMMGKGGVISPYPQANAFIVRATAADLCEIIKIVKEIDVPRQQVYIEAKFLDLTDEASKKLGIKWSMFSNEKGGYEISAGPFTQTSSDTRDKVNTKNLGSSQKDGRESLDSITGPDSSTPLGSTSSKSDKIEKSIAYNRDLVKNRTQTIKDIRNSALSADQLSFLISAIQEISGATVVSNPKIMVANQETASLFIGKNLPNVKMSVTPGQQGQESVKSYDLNPLKPYLEIGVTLKVTPTINRSNIVVTIEPKLSESGDDVNATVGPPGEEITFKGDKSKTLKTVFCLESGMTAVIGGLISKNDDKKVVKIPLLGDIPLIGKFLFSHTEQIHSQVETIIFVTVSLANPLNLKREDGLPEDAVLTQPHLLSQKKLRDQRATDAVIAVNKEKAEKTP